MQHLKLGLWRSMLLGTMARQAHFPFWPVWPTQKDTVKLTAYKKIRALMTFLRDQVWQQYTYVQNWSNLLSLNATYRLLFSEMILMQNHGRQRAKCSFGLKLPICMLTLIFVRSLVTVVSSEQLHPLPADYSSSLSDCPNLLSLGHNG